MLLGIVVAELGGKQLDVLAALAQWWHLDAYGCNTVEKVLAELSTFHHLH